MLGAHWTANLAESVSSRLSNNLFQKQSEMGQLNGHWIKALASNPTGPNLTLRSHIVKGENELPGSRDFFATYEDYSSLGEQQQKYVAFFTQQVLTIGKFPLFGTILFSLVYTEGCRVRSPMFKCRSPSNSCVTVDLSYYLAVQHWRAMDHVLQPRG